MYNYKYIPKKDDGLFLYRNRVNLYRNHVNTEGKDFLKYLLAKGILSIAEIKLAIQETNEEMTNIIAETIDEQTTEIARKLK